MARYVLPCVCFGVESGKNGAKLDKLFRSRLHFGRRHVEGSTVMRAESQKFTNFLFWQCRISWRQRESKPPPLISS